MKVLFITASHHKSNDTNDRVDIWLEDFAIPYNMFIDAGATVTIATTGMTSLFNSILVKDVKSDDFDVVFLPDGHGPFWDIAGNRTITKLLEAFNNSGKPIGAVGHGVAGLLSVKDAKGGLLVKGKRLTGFSNSEERLTGSTDVISFLLADTLLSLGALYTCTTDNVSYVVVDGNIITGQNPASAEEVAKRIVAWYSIIKMQNLVIRRENV